MKCRLLRRRLLRRRRAHLRASTPGAAIAAQLRAQILCSTDPADWRDWRAKQKDARAIETANLSFCEAFADCRHGPKRDEGHGAAT